MLRKIALAAAMTLVANAAYADGHLSHKLCHGKTLRGETVNFKCKASEKCSFDVVTSKGSCRTEGELEKLVKRMLPKLER
ncbi:MAG: hypothetical protein AAFO75_01550 [Pseudomonadota bacterium]